MPEQTWKPAEGAAIDTYIDEGNPAVNYGGNNQLIFGWNNAPIDLSVLMLWDLSPIPPGSTIEIATLSLWNEVAVVKGGSFIGS
ncbi:unnamed protein product [marine sediment metagenome]|uniref:Uncharacterized protein n=1 Tax=marine sediment metagenome TaxID=412755 RepID=X1CWN6_9ZZZZ